MPSPCPDHKWWQNYLKSGNGEWKSEGLPKEMSEKVCNLWYSSWKHSWCDTCRVVFNFDSKSSHVAHVRSIISPNTCSRSVLCYPSNNSPPKTTAVGFFFSVRQLSGRLQPPLSDIGDSLPLHNGRQLLSSKSPILRIPSPQRGFQVKDWAWGQRELGELEERHGLFQGGDPGTDPETRGQSVCRKESGHQQLGPHPRPLSFGRLLPERCPFAEKCQAHHIPPATQRSSLGSAARSDKG